MNKELRSLLYKKLGINEGYECENYVGDHSRWLSTDFQVEDVKFLEKIDVDKEKFDTIYQKYLDNIVEVIKRNPYMRLYAKMDKGEMSEFNEEKVKKQFTDFMQGKQELNSRNRIVLKTFLQLLDTYDINDLLNENEAIKKELQNGIFDLIKEDNEALSQDERDSINKLDWEKEDVENYYNLGLLKKRIEYIKEGRNTDPSILVSIGNFTDYLISQGIPKKDELTEFKNKDNIKKQDFYSLLMKNIYQEFEIINRNDIINSLCNDNNILIHSYRPRNDIYINFKNTIVNRERLKEGKELLPIIDTTIPEYPEIYEEYKEKILESNLDAKCDELIPSESFEVTEEDIKNNLGYRLDVFKSNQLACNYITMNDFLNNGIGYEYAIAFSTNLKPENIYLSCDQNADSNLGIDNIPYKNKFEELSKTSHELNESEILSKGVKVREVLLKRTGLKVDKLICKYNSKEIESSGKRKDIILEEINDEIERAKKMGIEVEEYDLSKMIDEKNDYEEQDDHDTI